MASVIGIIDCRIRCVNPKRGVAVVGGVEDAAAPL